MMNLLQQQGQQTKKSVRFPANLGILISLLEKQIGSKYTDINKLAQDLKDEFDIDITVEDVLIYHSVDMEQQEIEIMYRTCKL